MSHQWKMKVKFRISRKTFSQIRLTPISVNQACENFCFSENSLRQLLLVIISHSPISITAVTFSRSRINLAPIISLLSFPPPPTWSQTHKSAAAAFVLIDSPLIANQNRKPGAERAFERRYRSSEYVPGLAASTPRCFFVALWSCDRPLSCDLPH